MPEQFFIKHELRVLPKLHKHLYAGQKTREIRVRGSKFDEVFVGHILVFQGRPTIKRKVVARMNFQNPHGDGLANFDYMFDCLERMRVDFNTIWPGYDRARILTALRGFYNPSREARGAIMFTLQPV